jgi:hypothetical protein
MTKSVRFLIVFIIFIVIIIFSRENNFYRTIADMATPTFRVESTAVDILTDEPTLQRNLVLVEFFSGL